MNGSIIEQYKVTSESSGNDYTVSKMVDGSWQCGCRGWKLHTPRRDCKHIRHIQTHGGIPMDPLLTAMDKANRKVLLAEMRGKPLPYMQQKEAA